MRGRQPVFLLLPLLLLAGCGGNQSALNPMGPVATSLRDLSVLLFVFGAFVLGLIVIAIGLAMRGSQATKAMLASPSTVVWGGIAFPAVTLTLLLAYGLWLTRESQARLADGADLRIEVTGEQWWWRLAYKPNNSTRIVSANEIRIPVGRPVVFDLKAADVIHSFWVPSLAGKVDMVPGRTTRLRLQADAPGVYRGQCAEYCGGPHALMAFEVVALPESEFNDWMSRQLAPALEPTTDIVRQGQRLFLAGGCGGCHAVRGTSANGTIGPDLTHLGSRRSIGADSRPLTVENIAAFVRNSQSIKPGNRMPPFNVFSSDELTALASYLASLR
jgi:cytochrome c oxidase subunit II